MARSGLALHELTQLLDRVQRAEKVASDAERVARALRQRATEQRARYDHLVLLETQDELPFEEEL